MNFRRFQQSDLLQIVTLFYETVHSINRLDYTQAQVDAWAPINEKEAKMCAWKDSLNRNITYVAEENEEVVGFSDMTYDGHLDRLYIHKNYQRQGIAAALVGILELEATKLNHTEIHTEASITAKTFFERMGYVVMETQNVELKGVQLPNFKMMKKLM